MKVLVPRSKLVSVRLSEEEYKRLQTVCGARHERSVSDCIRSSILEMSDNDNLEQRYARMMKEIEATLQQQTRRMAVMDRKLAKLMLLFVQSGEQNDSDEVSSDQVFR